MIGDPKNTKAYDRIRKLWEPVSVDYKYPGIDHVSYIKFDTDKNTIEKIFVSKGAICFIKCIEKMILNGSSSI